MRKADNVEKLSRTDILLSGVLVSAITTFVLYEFWQFYSVGTIDLFGKMSGWHKLTYSEHPNGVLLVLAIYTGILAYCAIPLIRTIVSLRADNT
jgi:hypothetical protein